MCIRDSGDHRGLCLAPDARAARRVDPALRGGAGLSATTGACLLYTSDAADERSSVDLGGRRIIKKKKLTETSDDRNTRSKQGQATAHSANEARMSRQEHIK